MYDSQAVTDGSWYGGVPLVEPRREPGHAHRVPFLGWRRSQDRRLPALLVRALRRQNEPTPESQQARIDDTLAAPPACRRSPALHRHLLLRARPRGPRVRSRRAETRAAALKMDAWSASSKPRSRRPACPSIWSSSAITAWSNPKATGSPSTSSPTSPASTPSARSSTAKPKRSRARLQPAQAASSQFVVYRLKNVPAGLNYNQNPREGDPVLSPRDRTPFAPTLPPPANQIIRPPSACTASIRTSRFPR
jgi:hypothetical protein